MQRGSNLWFDFLAHVGIVVVLFFISWFLVPATKRTDFRTRLAATDVIFSIPFYPALAYLAVMSTVSGWHSVESRWFEASWYSYHYVLCYVVKMIAHIPVILLTESLSQAWIMCLHHTLSLVCYTSSICHRRMLWWGAFDGVCEITTIFMNNLYLLRGFDLKDDYPKLLLINGALFWFSYIPFRLILFPVWLYWFYYDLYNHHDVLSRESWTVLEMYLYPVTNVALFVLSAFWFLRITKGFLKLLAPGEDTKQQPVKKKL